MKPRAQVLSAGVGRKQAGRTILETMIGLAIGAVLTGVVRTTISSSGLSGRRLDAQSSLNESGQVALTLLAASLRMAGYWRPDSEVAAVDRPGDGQPMLFGCVNGFSDPGALWSDLRCAAGNGAQALAVRYQPGEAGTPMGADCAGNDVVAAGFAWIEDRYYVQVTGTETGNPALVCRPTTGGPAVVLVDDVESMTLRFGVSPVAAAALVNRAFDANGLEGRTARYLQADALVRDCAGGAVPANSWCAVTAVEVCLVMRSPVGATDPSSPYVDCNSAIRMVDDSRLRRALSTTVSLRNRTAAPLRAAQEPSS